MGTGETVISESVLELIISTTIVEIEQSELLVFSESTFLIIDHFNYHRKNGYR